jgi:hypothetical protein
VATKQTHEIRWYSANTCTFGYFNAKYWIKIQFSQKPADFAQNKRFFSGKMACFWSKTVNLNDQPAPRIVVVWRFSQNPPLICSKT